MTGWFLGMVVALVFFYGKRDLHTRICDYLDAKADEARANARRARWPDHRGG